MCCPHTRFKKPLLDAVIAGFPPITPHLPVCVFCGGVMLWGRLHPCPELLLPTAGRKASFHSHLQTKLDRKSNFKNQILILQAQLLRTVEQWYSTNMGLF